MYKFLLLLATLLLFNPNSFAQDDDEINIKEIKASRVSRVKNKLIKVRKEVYALKRKIKKEKNSQIKFKLYEDLQKLQEEYNSHELTYIAVYTDVNLEDAVKEGEFEKPNLVDEVMEILKPALDTFKRISSRPRKIEQYRSRVEKLKEKIAAGQVALKQLVKKRDENKKKKDYFLQHSINRVSNLVEELQLKLEDNKVKLHKELSSDKTLIGELQRVVLKFLRTKGKNILLAIIIFFICLWPLRRWRSNILNVLRKVLSKYDGGTAGSNEWMMRPLTVIYAFATFFFAFSMGILCLYLLNDWVLVTVILLMVSLTIWSLKDKIPLFIEQAKLLLNFGPVREKERVEWKGLPWRVKRLGIYCTLENPDLQGASVRVQTKDMLTCHSRIPSKGESWFPTSVSDWVELSDGSYGQIMSQTPEMICLRLIGGALKYIKTLDFLSLNPINLSKGYLVTAEFGVDYGHQAIVLDEIVSNIKNHLYDVYKDNFLGSSPKFKKLLVEFDNAAESSLNIRVNIDVSGVYAHQKLTLTRDLNQQLVHVCNAEGYVIPFKQVTVHMNPQ